MDLQHRQQQAELAPRGCAKNCTGTASSGVATTWVDNSGITRVKAVPLARLERAAAWGIGASPVFDGFLADDSIVAGRFAGSPVGDLRLHPDLSRVVPLAAAARMGVGAGVRYRQDGTVHPQDQRSVAMRAVEQLLAESGQTARMAFEIEWVISTDESDFMPGATGPAYGFTRLAERADYLREVLVALDKQGVAVDQIHPEYARRPVRAVRGRRGSGRPRRTRSSSSARPSEPSARALGLHASFSPKVDGDRRRATAGTSTCPCADAPATSSAAGNGRFGLTDRAESFAAGILDRVPALLAVGAPSAASYLRLIPSHWAGAFQVWGLENREAALRLVTGSPGDSDAANLEIKVFDLSANPYLTVAAVLFAGLAGMEERRRTARAGRRRPGVDRRGRARAESGIRRCRATLAESTAAFEADDALATGLRRGARRHDRRPAPGRDRPLRRQQPGRDRSRLAMEVLTGDGTDAAGELPARRSPS